MDPCTALLNGAIQWTKTVDLFPVFSTFGRKLYVRFLVLIQMASDLQRLAFLKRNDKLVSFTTI